MAATMRAAQLVGPGRALELTEVPRPVASPGEALVRVAACGFCHTDLHYLDHGVLTAKPPPVTLGHEISGTVEAVGTPLEEDRIGQRVLVPAVLPCGRCGFCRSGRENICPDLRMLGNHLDGGFAEFVRVPVRDLVPLPPEIDLERGAVIADALTTPYHAVVHRARVRSGEWVAVVGCGGVGINAVQFAAAAGANVLAVDLRAERLETARRLGAVETVDPAGVEDLGREVRRRTGGGVDVALEAVGTPKTVLAALSTLRRGGRLCVLGYSDLTVALPLNRLMFFEYEIVGSLGCRPVDYPRVIELVRRGRVQVDPVVTMRRPLAEVNAAADDLRQGRGLRTIIVP
ncbi:MAG TPA: zinc-binding dehydrogenase [Thermoplasmata archaeon]|nr:zinc-binding dehydrogenase [Thermoplasmata archaeon]